MREFPVSTLSDLPDAVKWVLDRAEGRRKIMLYGEMGVGKTTFTKAFCQHFGVEGLANSPTFSLVNEYFYEEKNGEIAQNTVLQRTPGGEVGVFEKKAEKDRNLEQKVIHHLDLYRLKNMDEALDMGIEDYLYDDSYCLIEWPQIIESILPEDTVLKISLELGENSTRRIVIL